MSGHKNFRELAEKVRARPGAAERLAQYRAEAEQEVTLAQLRRARAYTQAQLAASLETGQGHVSRLERQTDLYLSTLRSYVEAMGGRLELRAIFDDLDVLVDQLEDEPAGKQLADPSTLTKSLLLALAETGEVPDELGVKLSFPAEVTEEPTKS